MMLFPCNNRICDIKDYCFSYFKNCDVDESSCNTYMPRTVEDNRVVCDNYVSPLKIDERKKDE